MAPVKVMSDDRPLIRKLIMITYRNDVTPCGPFFEQVGYRLKAYPVTPSLVDDKGLIERPEEENGREKEGLGRADQAERPIAH